MAEERSTAKDRLTKAEKQLEIYSSNIEEIVDHHLEATDKTISPFKDELQNKDVIIESLEHSTFQLQDLKQKADSLESSLFEARVEASDFKKK